MAIENVRKLFAEFGIEGRIKEIEEELSLEGPSKE